MLKTVFDVNDRDIKIEFLFIFSVRNGRLILADFWPLGNRTLLWGPVNRAGNSLISFLSKSLVFVKKFANERADSLKKNSNLLIFGQQPEQFVMVAHFWWATWANHSWSLIFGRVGHPFFSKERNVLTFFSVLYKKTERSLHSFLFFIKEQNDLCVLFRSL